MTGAVSDVLKLADQKPLGYPTRFGINPAETAGSAGVDLHFLVPMRKNVSVDSLSISIKAATNGFAIALGRARLSEGAMVFDIDNNRLHAAGTAALATSRLALDWTEDFHARGDVTTRVSAKGSLDDAGRAMLGIRAADYLKGATPVTATLTGHRGALLTADATLDLAPASLSYDLLGIDKPRAWRLRGMFWRSSGRTTPCKAPTSPSPARASRRARRRRSTRRARSSRSTRLRCAPGRTTISR